MEELIRLCRGGIDFRANPQIQNYESIPAYFEKLRMLVHDFDEDLSPKLQQKIIDSGTLLELTCYTSTVGHYTFYHHDYDKLVQEALEVMRGQLSVLTA